MKTNSNQERPLPGRRSMERWLSEAAILKSNGDDRGATLLTQHAAELFAEVQEWEAEALSIHDAALESGYSEDRLRKLVGEGRIPNAGRRGKPRVKRADLPRKANSRKSAIAVHELREHTDDALFLDIVHTKHGSA